MPILDKIKDAKVIFILVSVLIALWMVYKIVTSIIDSTNRTAAEQNVAVAVQAKADLENATKALNEATKATEQLIEKVKADEELRKKQKEIIESNKKELEIVINKIDNINNNDVSHEETISDKGKSKIIIDSIWEIYQGDKNGK